MADYGIKVSQKGYDVNTCADHQLLFSSSWPLLKIEAQGSKVISDATQDVTIYTHSLGYVPMFFGYQVSSGTSYLNTKAYYLSANSSTLKWLGATKGAAAGSVTIYYYIYRYDMTTNFTSSAIETSSATANIVDDYGFKISKAGKDISSTDGRDFVVHSSYRSLQIHKTVAFTGSAPGWTENITHGLGYEPFYLFYFEDTGGGMQLIFDGDQEFIGDSNSTTVDVGGVPTGDGFVCIFKDPYTLEE